MRGLRLITLAAIPVLVLSACSGSSSTPAPSNGSGNSVVVPAGNTKVKWFVGLGGGTQPNQIKEEQAFVANYNKTNSDKITIAMEIVPNANAYDVLKTEIAAGNPPDIIGPVGVKGRNGFEGLFADLAPLITKNNFDLTGLDPALVDFFKQGGQGQVGLPYVIFPGYIWYNKDIFTTANKAALPTTMAAQYEGATWDWAALGKLAAALTVDKNGKVSTDASFDAKNIVQYGMDFQWADYRRLLSCFGGGSFIADDGKTAQIPQVWKDATNWWYNAVWTGHFIPNGAAASSQLLAQGNSQSSGHVAMNAAWGWSISSIAADKASAKVKTWDMAVMPQFQGKTTSPMDADTFTITKSSKVQDAAFKAMVAIMADPALMKTYGGEPAKASEQKAYFDSFDTTLAAIYPGNKVTWSVLGEMAKVPAVPSHEANMPNFTKAQNDYGATYTKMLNTAGLDVDAELAKLQATLQADFDGAQVLYTSAP